MQKSSAWSSLIDEQAINSALEQINAEDFYDQNHIRIFNAMLDLIAKASQLML